MTTRPACKFNRDGQSIALVAVIVIPVLCVIALAVDLVMLYTARAEAQRDADAIALAGASAFLGNAPSGFVPDAKARARRFAAHNYVLSEMLDTATVSETTQTWESSEVAVRVIPNELKVRVRVRRSGIPLWFARMFGVNVAAVSAVATAEAATAGTSSCMIPFAIPEPENPTLGQYMVLKSADSSLIGGVDPFFAPFSMPDDPSVPDYCPRARGDDSDGAWGGRNVCSTCDPQTGRFPGEGQGGWHQSTPVNAWLAGESNPSGTYYPADGYTENVCGNNCSPISVGERQTLLTGDMDGPTAWGVNARLAQDPKITWNAGDQHLWRGPVRLDDYAASPRVIKVPTFDSGELTHSSQREITITGFAYFFLEKGPSHGFYNPTQQTEIVGRFLWFAPGSGPGSSPYTRALRLIE